MSRYVKRKDELEIAYGYDDGMGYFFQVFVRLHGRIEEGLVLNEGIPKERMLELMKQYNINDKLHLELVELNIAI